MINRNYRSKFDTNYTKICNNGRSSKESNDKCDSKRSLRWTCIIFQTCLKISNEGFFERAVLWSSQHECSFIRFYTELR